MTPRRPRYTAAQLAAFMALARGGRDRPSRHTAPTSPPACEPHANRTANRMTPPPALTPKESTCPRP